jgi:hypothetical protein
MTDSTKKHLRAVEVTPDEFSLIKPGELVDVVEIVPLTLQDRRIYNLLILNAWSRITEPIEHCLHKRELRGSHNVNDRIGDSINRLMGALAVVKVMRDGKPYTRKVQLLAPTDESDDADGLLYYSFHAGLRAIIKQSSQFARLQKDVMFAFSSKYALALYEMVQKRGNLQHKWSEEFPLERFRALLGVEKAQYPSFRNLNQRVISPAVLEVNGLGEFGCKVEPVTKGRKVVAVRLSWWAKTLDERKAAFLELRACRVGRRARLRGTVETIAPELPRLVPKPATLPARGHSGLSEASFRSLQKQFPGIDIEGLERQFIAWNERKGGPPENYIGAFIGFIKSKQK